MAVDRDRQPGRFLLTGSANVLTVPRLSESLAGRMEIIPLFPFSAGELAGVPEGFLERLFAGSLSDTPWPNPGQEIVERLSMGGYPEANQRPDSERRAAWFGSYISTILQRDVRELARIEAIHSLPHLLNLLATRTSGLLNLADVGRDCGLPHSTLTRYMALLESVFLIHRLPAWSPNLGASDFSALRWLREQLGKRFRSGVVLYLGDQTVPYGDQLTLVPVSALWSPSKLPPGTRDTR